MRAFMGLCVCIVCIIVGNALVRVYLEVYEKNRDGEWGKWYLLISSLLLCYDMLRHHGKVVVTLHSFGQ